jgi:hypothetical protein
VLSEALSAYFAGKEQKLSVIFAVSKKKVSLYSISVSLMTQKDTVYTIKAAMGIYGYTF